MKTEQEINSLKWNWSHDPSWDIENTEGFEEHKKDLYIYRLEVENAQLRRRLTQIDDCVYLIKETFKF